MPKGAAKWPVWVEGQADVVRPLLHMVTHMCVVGRIIYIDLGSLSLDRIVYISIWVFIDRIMHISIWVAIDRIMHISIRVAMFVNVVDVCFMCVDIRRDTHYCAVSYCVRPPPTRIGDCG